jgi:PhzF family phenazine biosynthesis protein
VLRYAAFTSEGAGGNPAGIVLDASGLADAEMLAIAAEVGYSETAFLRPTTSQRSYDVRYFSPLAEVAFCGHVTIASAVALAERHSAGPFTFNTQVGPIAIDTALIDDQLVATLTSVPTHTRVATADEVSDALLALQWEVSDLDPRYPVHVAYGGVDHLVLAVRDRARLAALDYDYPALDKLMATQGWTTAQLVHAESPTLFHARNPFPPGGVVEDPATGAAAAAFGGYLRELRLVPLPATVTILQGYDMGRPSRLLVDIAADSETIRVTGTANRITGD